MPKPILTREEELELIKKAQKGDTEAENELLLRNEGFIHLMVRKFTLGYGEKSDVNDLLQEGRLGYLQAIRLFNPKFKCRLGSYASWYIKKRIAFHFRNKMSSIRIPDNKAKEINSVILKCRKLNREPTMDDFCKALKIKDTWRVQEILNAYRNVSPITYENMIVSNELEYRDFKIIKKVLENRDDIDKDSVAILFKFYGVFGYEEQKLEDIAKEHGISVQIARLRMYRVLFKIKQILEGKKLKYRDFLD